MPLRVRDIAAAVDATPWMSADQFRHLARVHGSRNVHLVEPHGHGEPGSERRLPLPLDAEVHGDFLTLVYCGHDPSAWLCEHDSMESLEAAILSPTGVLNLWHEFMLAFVRGAHRPYDVLDRAGNVVVKSSALVRTPNRPAWVDEAGCRIIWPPS